MRLPRQTMGKGQRSCSQGSIVSASKRMVQLTYSEGALVGGDSGRELGQVEELGREEAHDTKHGNTAVLQLSFLFRHQT